MIGKRAVSFNRYTFTKFEALEDGRIKISNVVSIDPGSDLPNFVKEDIAEQSSDAPWKLIKILREKLSQTD